VVLARRLCAPGTDRLPVSLGILAASGMMYLRLLVLILVLNSRFLVPTLVPFLLLGLGTIGYALVRFHRHGVRSRQAMASAHNPLELGTAFLFAALFILMLLLSQWVLHRFGAVGLQVLSFTVGFADIDPFVLSLLKGDYAGVSLQQLAAAMVIAAGSNDLLKAFYTVMLSGWRAGRGAFFGLVLLAGVTLAWGMTMVW
jgi:uncharacterized membrane protein (DUF4010 family)